jgi:Ca2+-binding RTX toxin-like protein
MTPPSRIKPALAGLVAALAAAWLAAPADAALPQQAGTVDLGNARPNASADGDRSSDQAATAVSGAGDVNGDGLADVIVGAPLANPNGRTDAGSAFVVFGRADGASIDLSRIASGAGFRIDGAVRNDRLGSAVSRAGDMNGDGLADLIVGAREADNRGRSASGSAYVIFGKASAGAVDVGSLGSQGFRIDGATTGERAATSVAGGRDVNGDGRPDVMLGSPLADPGGRTNSGTVYVVFGKAGTGDVDTAALAGAGYAIDGAAAGDQLSAVAAIRDVDGDGRADVFTGARYADAPGRTDAGAAHVTAGKGDDGTVDLAAPAAATYVAHGAAAWDYAGTTLGQGGDLNGDGRSDLLLGAPGADPAARSGAGSAYLLFAPEAGGTHDLAALDSTWRIDGAAAGDAAGTAIDAGGDLNSDGRADLVVGAPLGDPAARSSAGVAHVLYGGGFGGTVDLAATAAPGFRAIGGRAGDQSGTASAFAGDVNGDGRGDLVVGAPRADRLGRGDNGSAALLWGYGSSNLHYPGAIATTVNQPIAPLGPQAIVRTGVVAFSIDPPLPDGLTLDPSTGVISGAPTAIIEQPASYRLTMTDFAGSVTVPVSVRVAPLPGRCVNPRTGGPQDDTLAGTSGGDRLAGMSGNDTVEGVAGDDCVTGDAGLDILFGGEGGDEMRGGIDHDRVDGGNGDDALFGDAGQDLLQGGAGNDLGRGGTGFDELDGGEGDDHLLGEDDSDALQGGAGGDRLEGGGAADRVAGGSGADVLLAGGGNDIVTDSAGRNKVDAGSGADVISVRNGARDTVRCGKGRDRVSADRFDKLSGCEKVRRGGGKKPRKRKRRR